MKATNDFNDVIYFNPYYCFNIGMTKSEKLLEKAFESSGITYSKIPESSSKTPDYKVFLDGIDSYWEVKELQENPDEEAIRKGDTTGLYSICSDRVKRSIESACEQFERYNVESHPCVIVLHDARGFATFDPIFPQTCARIALGSNYNEETGRTFKGHLIGNQKTYVSAVVVLADTGHMYIYHNHNAAIPLVDNSELGCIPKQNQYQQIIEGRNLYWVPKQ